MSPDLHVRSSADFYPRDAMLARVLAMALCLSVTSPCSIETDEQIELVISMNASFDQSYCAMRNFRQLQKLGYFPLELCPNLPT